MTSEAAEGDDWKAYVHPDDRQHVLDAWQVAIHTGTAYEVEHRLRDSTSEEYRGSLLLEALQEETSCSVFLATSGEMALNMLQTVMPALFILMSAALPQGNTTIYPLTTLQKPFELDILLELVAELLTA
ncbi:PAS domain-containing protein [Ktedonobacteria bacterium brp13]|nr:PAS domain-containing protein [Ktedonobacteria bacterium brp13]